MKAKINRKEAEEIINLQMNWKTESGDWKARRHHYGKCELIELLNKIYGKGTEKVFIKSNHSDKDK